MRQGSEPADDRHLAAPTAAQDSVDLSELPVKVPGAIGRRGHSRRVANTANQGGALQFPAVLSAVGRPSAVLWLAAPGHSATAETGYGPAGVGGRAAMGRRLVPGGVAVWAGLAGLPTRLATAAPGRLALVLREWAGCGL